MYKHRAASVLQRAVVVTFKVLPIIRNPYVCIRFVRDINKMCLLRSKAFVVRLGKQQWGDNFFFEFQKIHFFKKNF